MTTESNAPAFPSENDRQTGPDSFHYSGLSKRELFAAMAMQGLCLRAEPQYKSGPCNDAIVNRSVVLADALIAALNSNPEPK